MTYAVGLAVLLALTGVILLFAGIYVAYQFKEITKMDIGGEDD